MHVNDYIGSRADGFHQLITLKHNQLRPQLIESRLLSRYLFNLFFAILHVYLKTLLNMTVNNSKYENKKTPLEGLLFFF